MNDGEEKCVKETRKAGSIKKDSKGIRKKRRKYQKAKKKKSLKIVKKLRWTDKENSTIQVTTSQKGT